MPEPIRRHEALQPLSRDHHHGLLLCWKIRYGVRKGIAVSRISDYIHWCWENLLSPHFVLEEQWVFPVLPSGSGTVRKAVGQHRQLKKMVENGFHSVDHLQAFADLLNDHIRFEERTLFQLVQEKGSAKQLHAIQSAHRDPVREDAWEDQFWEYGT